MTTNIDAASTTRRPRFPIRALQKLWRLARDAPYRNMMCLYLMRPKGTFQPFNDTLHDRYPRIFRFVQATLGAESKIKILSFGCSTGDEVLSLRHYFSRAVIKGLDINRANISVCRQRLNKSPDDKIFFATASSTKAEPSGDYDAIFCMAVLRHGSLGLPGVTRCDHLIRFEDFARAVADFERCLKPGGLLIIRHCNFRLRDAPAGQAFETILQLPAGTGTPLFGADNRLLPDREYPDTVFRKRLTA
jgi:2-polyprenyl-3-methyl-5-hydroxy-6-metoxy-1,4-benzoquinol methylase